MDKTELSRAICRIDYVLKYQTCQFYKSIKYGVPVPDTEENIYSQSEDNIRTMKRESDV